MASNLAVAESSGSHGAPRPSIWNTIIATRNLPSIQPATAFILEILTLLLNLHQRSPPWAILTLEELRLGHPRVSEFAIWLLPSHRILPRGYPETHTPGTLQPSHRMSK